MRDGLHVDVGIDDSGFLCGTEKFGYDQDSPLGTVVVVDHDRGDLGTKLGVGLGGDQDGQAGFEEPVDAGGVVVETGPHPGGIACGDRRFEAQLPEWAQCFLENCFEQSLPVAEVVEDAALGDADALGDLAGGQTGDAALAQHRERRGCDLLAADLRWASSSCHTSRLPKSDGLLSIRSECVIFTEQRLNKGVMTVSKKWLTLAAVCTGVFMLLLDVTIVNVALPDIQRDLGSSISGLQWVIDAYALTLAAFLLTSGTAADILGRKRVFAWGIVVFTVGSLACGLSPNIGVLIASRAVQGVGGAIMFATSLALLAQAFAPRERGVAFGVFGAVTGVSVAVGPVLGGVLTSGLSWHWIFYVNIPVGILALAITLIGVDESRAPGVHRIDWAGCVTFSAALGFGVFGLIRSHADGWDSVTVAGSLLLSVLLLAVFVVVENMVRQPMFDGSLLRVPTFGGGLIAAWTISASMFSLLTYLVIYLQTIMGYSALEAGLRFLPFTGVVFVAAAIAGRLSDQIPVRWLIGPGFVLIAVGLFLMRGTDPTGSWTQLVPGFVIAGVGTGLINPPLASTAVGVVDQQRAGMASGINSTFRQIGIATGVALLGSLLAAHFSDRVTAALTGGPLDGQARTIGDAAADGNLSAVLAGIPAPMRAAVARAAAEGFVDALDRILLIAAVVALIGGVVAAILIRQKDFHPGAGDGDEADVDSGDDGLVLAH